MCPSQNARLDVGLAESGFALHYSWFSVSNVPYNSINAAPAMRVGTNAPRKRPSGAMPPSPNRDDKIDIPAGFGALAITVNPPPVIAPAITEYFSESEIFGTNEAR